MVKKSAQEYQQRDKELLLKDIKSLTKIRDDLKKDNKVTEETREFERSQFAYSQRIESFKGIIKKFAKTIADLKKEVRQLEKVRDGLLSLITQIKEESADTAKKLTASLNKRKEEIEILDEDIEKKEEQSKQGNARLIEINDEIVVLRDEREEIKRQIGVTEKELSSLNDKVADAESVLSTITKKITQFRTDALALSKGKRELAIRLHDVKALEFRLEPEFQKTLKRYIQTH